MNFLPIRVVAIAMLVAFLTATAAWSYSAERMSHDLHHAAHPMQAVSDDHDEDHDHHASDAEHVDHLPLSADEHSLLHAVAVLQPAPLPAFTWQPPSLNKASPPRLTSPKVAHATREPPFRPPRHLLS